MAWALNQGSAGCNNFRRVLTRTAARRLVLVAIATCTVAPFFGVGTVPATSLLAAAGTAATTNRNSSGITVLPDKHGDAGDSGWLVFASCAALLLLLEFLRRRTERSSQGSPGKIWNGAKLKPLALCCLWGWVLRFLVPIPEGVTRQAWSMLAIFTAMILGVVTDPLPTAATTVVTLALAVFTGTCEFADGVKAFTDEVVWLVCLAFFFARGFEKTGLGERIALTAISVAGHTTLGLAYGINFAEHLLAAAMPSSAARAAAVFYPITVSVCKASGSDPADGTRLKCGAFLVESLYQATPTSSCLFLSGAAQNYFVLKLAAGVGVDVPSPFRTWFVAAVGPAIVSFLLTPLLALALLPPEVKKTPKAPEEALRKLKAMGPASDSELVFGAVVVTMVLMWAGSSSFNIPPVVTALCGLAALLLAGVLTWEDCASNKAAWSTYVSFAALVSLAAMLNKLGVVRWMADCMSSKIEAAGLSPIPAFLVILGCYWIMHYLFASQVAHVSSLYQPFLLMLMQTGTPALPAVFALAFASNLFATLTPYASAQSAVFCGGKYITSGEWYKAGFFYMVFYFVLWVVVGAAWWRLIGFI